MTTAIPIPFTNKVLSYYFRKDFMAQNILPNCRKLRNSLLILNFINYFRSFYFIHIGVLWLHTFDLSVIQIPPMHLKEIHITVFEWSNLDEMFKILIQSQNFISETSCQQIANRQGERYGCMLLTNSQLFKGHLASRFCMCSPLCKA